MSKKQRQTIDVYTVRESFSNSRLFHRVDRAVDYFISTLPKDFQTCINHEELQRYLSKLPVNKETHVVGIWIRKERAY